MKKIIVIACFFFVLRPVLAQKINMDSLVKTAIARYGNTKLFLKINRDSLFKQLPKAGTDRERIKLIYQITNDGQLTDEKEVSWYYKILDWAKKNHDPVIEAVILSGIGWETTGNGDLADGQKICLDALHIAEKTGNNQALAVAYDNLGTAYGSSMAEIQLSLFYLKQSLKYAVAGHDDLYTGYAYADLGNEYSRDKKDTAIYYLQKGIEHLIQHGFPRLAGAYLEYLGELQATDELKLKYFREGVEYGGKMGDTTGMAAATGALAALFFRQNKLDSAVFYAHKAFGLTRYTSQSIKVQSAVILAGIYQHHNADSALKYTLLFFSLRDKMRDANKLAQAQATAYADQQRKQEIAAQKMAYQTTIRLYLLGAVIVFFVVLAFVFWRNNRQKQKANILLSEQKEEIESQRDELGRTLQELKITQTQLIQSEKMASLGELTAGIAHEIQNPLNFVNNFSDVNREMIGELKGELKSGNIEEALAIAEDLEQNEIKINHHGKRADFIVKGMMEHSRKSTGEKQPTNINVLCDEFLKLSYHGLRAKDKVFNAEMVTHFDPELPAINVSQQDIGRVMLNLFNNAFYAVNQKAKTAGADYKPTVEVNTSVDAGKMIISVKDNGNGIPEAIKDKIMQPFFTTKPTGEGTGLGLSLSYDIVVKGHGGKIDIKSKEQEFTEFVVSLPING